MRFSVVVPCFNEEQALPILLEQLVPALQRATEGAWEIIFVDDGSSDKTQQIIRSSSILRIDTLNRKLLENQWQKV